MFIVQILTIIRVKIIIYKGKSLLKLQRYEESIQNYDKVIYLNA